MNNRYHLSFFSDPANNNKYLCTCCNEEVMDPRPGTSKGGLATVRQPLNRYGSDWNTEESDLGCSHYRRKCQLVCPEKSCLRTYTCRFCHDETEGSHKLDRYNVSMIVCLVCHHQQPVGSTCRRCRTIFGRYYCNLCNLFSDEEQFQYHCYDCGLCRVGPKEQFFHCKRCDMCLSVDLRGGHRCVERASQSECPLCFEDLHTSRVMSRVLPCGHLIHRTCLDELLNKDHKTCPICRDPIPEKFATPIASILPYGLCNLNLPIASAFSAFSPVSSSYSDNCNISTNSPCNSDFLRFDFRESHVRFQIQIFLNMHRCKPYHESRIHDYSTCLHKCNEVNQHQNSRNAEFLEFWTEIETTRYCV
ncbi:unnamed protein product [Allacma fusca]|uniref:RING finger and CHY zinc finger domain-containing protein 1 n=1 Tax=Allacma fusca TaxID=39272 RepID=A0A8J2Q5T6_9HEXA|nr:unnamed protein product [Allacma fusca]